MRIYIFGLCLTVGLAAAAGCSSDDNDDQNDDPCATNGYPLNVLGCNGPPPGPQPADQFGGFCVPDEEDEVHWGSCVGEDVYCVYEEEDSVAGICVIECEIGTTYVSTGGCPEGYRCFYDAAYDEASCYPDCETSDDCGDGLICDEEGACYVPLESS